MRRSSRLLHCTRGRVQLPPPPSVQSAMSLITWVKSLFSRSRKRDISRLSPSSTDTEEFIAAEEYVDLSGGPLKEHHRRRALRDKRLVPKIKSPARQLG